MNLLSNALKFSHKKTDIEVDITYEVHESFKVPNNLIVSVLNRGVAISEQDLEQLFKPYSMLESGKKRNPHGTGLGLYICRKVLSSLGGTIWCEPDQDNFTVFNFKLPVIATSAS